MAQRREKKAKVDEAERKAAAELSREEVGAEDALARADDEPEPSTSEESSDESDEGEDSEGEDEGGEDEGGEDEGGEDEGGESAGAALAKIKEGERDEGDEAEEAAAQLGSERYVLAGFFAAGMLGAFVIGRAIHGVWTAVSNKDWFSQAVPQLAAVADEDKTTIGLVLGALISLVITIRTYRRPDIREWTDEVASELAKVKWPSRKEVWNSTVIVIAASTVATVYLALLDRLWAFITNIVYGDGS